MNPKVLPVLKETQDVFSRFEILWSKKIIPWHIRDVCPFLKEYSSKLNFTPPKRVLLPLCGKALELKWFYDKGFDVVGVEFIELPVQEFFKEQNLSFTTRKLPWAKVYETSDQRLKIYVADIYKIKTEEIGKFDVIWARGDYTSVKVADRGRYSKIMKQFCKEKFVYFLCTLQFDVPAGEEDKPPRSLSTEAINKLYGKNFKTEIYLAENTKTTTKY